MSLETLVEELETRLDLIEDWINNLQSRGVPRVYTNSVITTDATVTTIFTQSTESGTAYLFDIEVVGIRTDVAGNTAAYRRFFKAENIGGSVTIPDLDQVSTADATHWDHEDDTAWNVTVVVSGTNILIRVTGVAAQTINWTYRGSALQVS